MRHLINFVISAFCLMIFQWIGWITIVKTIAPTGSHLVNQLLVAGIVGFIFTVGLWIADWLFVTIVVVTCGLGCILFPVYYGLLGFAGFYAVKVLLPGWVTVNANIWQIILMGLLIAMMRVPSSSVRNSVRSED